MKEFDHYRDGYSQQINKAIAFSGQTQDFYTGVKARCLLDLFSKLRAPGPASKATRAMPSHLSKCWTSVAVKA